MLPFTVCPATCELCGNWLPQHQTSCPRNGVHPSQWSHSFPEPVRDTSEEQHEGIDYATLLTTSDSLPSIITTPTDFYL